MTDINLKHLMLDTLPLEERQWLKLNVIRKELQRGDILHAQGVAIDAVIFLIDGLATLQVEHKNGGRIEAGICGSNALIGCTAFLGEGTAPYHAISIRSGDAVLLPRRSFNKLGMHAPVLTKRIGYAAMDDCQRLAAALARQAFSSAQARIAYRLQTYMEANGADFVEITHSELARALALRRATVTICLQQLEDARAIRSLRGRIELWNAEKLAKLASA